MTASVMTVRFPGGKRVTAEYRGLTIETDQPQADGGSGAAPAPFDLFLASLLTCVGYYVLEFCAARGIAPGGIRVEQRWQRDPDTRRITSIEQDIVVPADFPAKYRAAVVRAAESCSVKKHLEHPPGVSVQVVAAP